MNPQPVVHAHQREAPVGPVLAVIGHQRGILAIAGLEVVGHEVALHRARPLQPAGFLELHQQDIQRLAVGVGVGGQTAVLLHVVAEAEGDVLAGDGPGGFALVDLVQQLAHKAGKARLVERLLEDVADQVGGFGLVHGDSIREVQLLPRS
ncbi:MAG: hypothetical protein V9H69_21475 [Anaerolineae bacterium]